MTCAARRDRGLRWRRDGGRRGEPGCTSVVRTRNRPVAADYEGDTDDRCGRRSGRVRQPGGHTQRSGTAGQRPVETRRLVPVVPDVLAGFVPCVVKALVTIDAKGRVTWPRCVRPDHADPTSVFVVGRSGVEVALDVGRDGPLGAVDARGRLTLRHGILLAAQIGPGDQLVIVSLPDPIRILLTLATNLAVRPRH